MQFGCNFLKHHFPPSATGLHSPGWRFPCMLLVSVNHHLQQAQAVATGWPPGSRPSPSGTGAASSVYTPLITVNIINCLLLQPARVFFTLLVGQYCKKCTSVPPPARFGKTTGSHPKVPQNNLLYWSDCEDTNSWPQSWHRTNIQELKCLPPSPFTLYDTGYLDSFT